MKPSSEMQMGHFEVVIVGAGMAGASLAYELAATTRVLLVEQEDQPGYHTTGRSAALFSEIYGNPAIRALSRASRHFLDSPGEGFGPHPLLTPRGSLFFGGADRVQALQGLHADVAPRAPKLQWLDGAEVIQRVPALRAAAAEAGVFEPDAADIDVHALHQGYLRGARQRGASVLCRTPLRQGRHEGGRWTLTLGTRMCTADTLVNAAGAWADELAVALQAQPLGLQPLRRTALVFEDRSEWASEHWPLTVDIDETLYFKPDAGRLLASPADETPSPACDAQPDEYDVAVLLDRLETQTHLVPKRITGRWAGLRTFAPDRTPVVGYDTRQQGLFWLAGQGGYGIQTAPALAQAAAALLRGRGLPERLLEQGVDAAALSPARF